MPDDFTKPTFDGEDVDFASLIDGMDGGLAYISEGAGFESEESMATALEDQTVTATLLTASFEQFGEFQEEPYDFTSTVEMKKTYNHVKQGKRSNSITLNFAGVTNEVKNWLESQLNKEQHTIIIQSADLGKLLVFNGLKWVMEWSSKADDWFLLSIKAEFSGPTANKVVPLPCPPVEL